MAGGGEQTKQVVREGEGRRTRRMGACSAKCLEEEGGEQAILTTMRRLNESGSYKVRGGPGGSGEAVIEDRHGGDWQEGGDRMHAVRWLDTHVV